MEKGKEVFGDLEKWSEKLNAMMNASIEGKAPQVFKIILMQKIAEEWLKDTRKRFGKKKVKEAEKRMDKIFSKGFFEFEQKSL